MPLPKKPEFTAEVYIDESSQTKNHYLVIGGLVIPKDYAARLEAHIIEARGPKFTPIDSNGDHHTIKWEKAKGHDHLIAYTRVIDAFFRFFQKHPAPMDTPAIVHCIAVDMTKRDDKKYNYGDADIGFSKDLNCLCVDVIGRRYRNAVFHLYPDRRTTNQTLASAQQIMNATIATYEDETRFVPFRKIDWAEPEQFQALQVVDIIIGALAYKLNRHYEADKPNKTKKALCDFIFSRAKIGDVYKNTLYYQRGITIFHRNFSPFPKKR
jgi:hypothetical protein